MRTSNPASWLCRCAAVALLSGTFFSTAAHAQQFELGTNLEGVYDYSVGIPFLDVFKLSREWYTQSASTFDTQEAARLNLDGNGWVRSLTPTGSGSASFTRACTLIFSMGAVEGGTENGKLPYPAGDYVVRYDGQGTLSYSLAATKNAAASTAGRDVITVKPQEPGIQICITQTDPAGSGNYLRNIRVYLPGHEALADGAVFQPAFLERLEPFGTLRFMDWMRTNDSAQAEVENRPLPANARYGTDAGVPAEVMIDLANLLDAKPWFNMPHRASDAYVSAFAGIVRSRLETNLDVYVEYSNEIWNNQFSQGAFIEAQGVAKFASKAGSNFDRRLNRFGERTAEICKLWRDAFGNAASRVHCVMGGQAANTYIAEQSLLCPFSTLAPCRNHGITGLAIAPYLGDAIGQPTFESQVQGWTADSDGGLSKLFAELNDESQLKESESGMATILKRMTFHATLAREQKVELMAYEGGQHLVGVGGPANNSKLNTLFDAANRDARMGLLYKRYLNAWIAAGGGLFMHFSDSGSFSRFGRWGALELATQTSSPKHDALVQISRSQCLLNFAERAFPQFFAPAGEKNQLEGGWVFRQYKGTGNIVGTSAADNSIYVQGPMSGGKVSKIAPMAAFLGQAGCR